MSFISKKYKKLRHYLKHDIFYGSTLSLPMLDAQNRRIISTTNKKINKFDHEINRKVSIQPPDAYTFYLNQTIPQSAWYVQCKDKKADIGFGRSVYQHEKGLIEGVWNGNFADLDYADAEYLFGSGLTLLPEKLIFTPPSYLLEGIFFLFNKNTQHYWVSNSLACLLSFDANDARLTDILEAIEQHTANRLKQGIFGYNPILFEDSDILLAVFCYHPFSIDKSGLSVLPQYHLHRFTCFEDYRTHVQQTIASLLENGQAAGRGHTPTFTPLATISSGYDSTAVAAIVRQLGVSEAVTIDVDVYEKNDSGLAAAAALGMHCIPCPHPFGSKIADLNVQETHYEQNLDQLSCFLATFGMGDDASWLAFQTHLPHKIVFTGHGGDEVWYKDKFIGNGLRKITTFELSLGEYRLQQGFVRIAVPYIGTAFANYIYRLNFLKEMEPYRLNNDYDRPIPRRFAEEAGVVRGQFAQIKRATNPNLVGFQKYKLQSFQKHIQQYRQAIHTTQAT